MHARDDDRRRRDRRRGRDRAQLYVDRCERRAARDVAVGERVAKPVAGRHPGARRRVVARGAECGPGRCRGNRDFRARHCAVGREGEARRRAARDPAATRQVRAKASARPAMSIAFRRSRPGHAISGSQLTVDRTPAHDTMRRRPSGARWNSRAIVTRWGGAVSRHARRQAAMLGGATAGGAGRVADDDRSGRALQGAGRRMAGDRSGAESGYGRGDVATGADGLRAVAVTKRPARDVALTGMRAKTAANRRR